MPSHRARGYCDIVAGNIADGIYVRVAAQRGPAVRRRLATKVIILRHRPIVRTSTIFHLTMLLV